VRPITSVRRKNIVSVETKFVQAVGVVEFFYSDSDLLKEKSSDKVMILAVRAVALSGVSEENFYLTLVDKDIVLLRDVPFASLKPTGGSAWIFPVPLQIQDRLRVQVRSSALSEEEVRLTFYGIKMIEAAAEWQRLEDECRKELE
jgi:hypothetical protein